MKNPNYLQRKSFLLRLIKEKKKSLVRAPEGSLIVADARGKDRYYCIMPGERGIGTYLGKKDLEKVRALAQKSYDQKVLRAAEQELKAWNMLAKFFPKMTVEDVYRTLSPVRQKFVTPVVPTDEEFRTQWEEVEYEPGRFSDGAAVFMTDRGERVRSKSEQLIANLLYRLGIPYRYEYPMEVVVDGRKRIWRPDFTILDVRNRREVYLEHFGMLDDQDDRDNYARNAFWKMKVYEENGHYDGGDMIFSLETGRAPLDITYVEMKVRRALGMPPILQPHNIRSVEAGGMDPAGVEPPMRTRSKEAKSYVGMSFPPERW